MSEQTHCPSCGVHKAMCGAVVPSESGSGWECHTCVARAKTAAKYEGVKLVIIPCPACSRTGMTMACLVCNKLGSVKVPDSEIRILSTATMPQVLTESAPSAG